MTAFYMKFLIILTIPNYGSGVMLELQELCLAIVKQHHDLSIFFYGDGVYNALKTIEPALDEYDCSQKFRLLSNEGVKLYFCETAGKRRGVIKQNAHDFCCASSLGELSSLLSVADRVVYL